MTEHYTKNTEDGVLHWCGRCSRLTKHFCSGGRLGRCMEHESQHETKKQKAAREKREEQKIQPTLFGMAADTFETK